MDNKPLDCYGPQMNGRGKLDIRPAALPIPPKKKEPKSPVIEALTGLSYRNKNGDWCMIIDPEFCDLEMLGEPADGR